MFIWLDHLVSWILSLSWYAPLPKLPLPSTPIILPSATLWCTSTPCHPCTTMPKQPTPPQGNGSDLLLAKRGAGFYHTHCLLWLEGSNTMLYRLIDSSFNNTDYVNLVIHTAQGYILELVQQTFLQLLSNKENNHFSHIYRDSHINHDMQGFTFRNLDSTQFKRLMAPVFSAHATSRCLSNPDCQIISYRTTKHLTQLYLPHFPSTQCNWKAFATLLASDLKM